jgi:hypothetical protein
MNIVDAVCRECKKPIRWLPGLPLLCRACSQKKASQAWFATLALMLVAALITILGSCSLLPTIPQISVTPTPGTQVQPEIVPFRPFTVVQICLDVTGSYPYADFKKAEGKVADAIGEFVRPNTGGLLVYASLITDNSWQDESTFFTARINAIPADPLPPVLAKYVSTGNVFLDKKQAKQVEQANDDALQSYQVLLKQRHAQLALLRQQVYSQTNKLRAYSPSQTNIGTDIFGCIERAAKRLQGVQANKLLLVSSDLQNNLLTQDVGSLDLTGIRVAVIYHYCADAATCQQGNAWFTGLVRRAKAQSVNLYDVAQSDNLPDVFSL